MKKATINTSIISAICAFFVCILTCICVNPTTVATAAETIIDINTLVDMADANNGKLFGTDEYESAEVATDFRISDVVDALLTTSADGKSKMYIPLEFINDFKQLFSNAENQKMMVYEDIITGETTVYMKHPKGCVVQEFSHCHCPEDINYPIAEFNYKGFSYTVYINDLNEEPCIAKKWNPEPNTNVYDCTSFESEVEMEAMKKKLQQAFSTGTEIDFIQEAHNGTIHGFVNNNGQKEEYLFKCYNKKPFGEELPEFIVSQEIIGETKQDGYLIIVEDGEIRIESGKRSGYLDHHNGWSVFDFAG